MDFKIQIFQARKVMESGLGPRNSWKINQMVATFLTHVHVSGLYVHCLLSRLGSAWVNYIVVKYNQITITLTIWKKLPSCAILVGFPNHNRH